MKNKVLRKILAMSLSVVTLFGISAVFSMNVSAWGNFTSIDWHVVGVVGTFNDWKNDVLLTDSDGDGIYEGVVTIDRVTAYMLFPWYEQDSTGEHYPTGEYYLQFKIRLDGEWSHDWGYYEPLYDRTYDSQTCVPVKEAQIGEPITFTVYFDTKNPDPAALANPESYAKPGTDDYNYYHIYYKTSINLHNDSEISANEITLGENITVNAKGHGGKTGYSYAVLYKKDTEKKWTLKQDFNTNDTIIIKPLKATDYDICVKVKDGDGKVVKKYFKLKVNEKLKNTSVISAVAIKKGNTVTLNGSAAGGAGNYTYAVYYKQKAQSKWTTKQNFSENSVVSVKPAQATDYNVCIKVKDKNGTIAKKYFEVTVTK